MADTMRIEILANGTIKTTTDPISAANHESASEFMRNVTALTGGGVTANARGDHAHHGHHHHHHHAGQGDHTH